MSDEITIRTNNVPRDILDSSELTLNEQKEFDYLDWGTLESGDDSASFFRFKGQIYDLGEFMTTSGMPEFNPITKWDGYYNDSFFSGLLVKYCNDFESVIVGTFYS